MEGSYGHGGPMLPLAWLTWLATSEARMWVYGLRPLYGALRFLHLVGAAGFVGALMLVELRLLGLWRDASLEPMRPALVGLMHWSFGLVVLTGAALFLYDPLRNGLHSMFLPKLLLIALGLLYAHGLRRLRVARDWRPLRRVAAGASLAVWLAVVGASTWNHVERPVSVTGALRGATMGKE